MRTASRVVTTAADLAAGAGGLVEPASATEGRATRRMNGRGGPRTDGRHEHSLEDLASSKE